MPVPKRKTGKSRRNSRRSHHALKAQSLVECESCGRKVLRHRVCPECGHYKDRLIVDTGSE